MTNSPRNQGRFCPHRESRPIGETLLLIFAIAAMIGGILLAGMA